eukprot:TRINITY_DN10538_c0_g1_i1.p1 TRINITY_DN10538_c0_g1~~TRINITY_DN10538_c0_g1_i1.p1  ORF type:complete len:578 (-),score=111.21 TRINITY_DN10538_c0_g1_i1:102-1655(-)
MEETRNKTNLFLGGSDTFEVNLEKSLVHGNTVGGHYVLGHIQGLGTIDHINKKEDGSWDVWIDIATIPNDIRKITYKGCVAIDGTSLTVAEVSGNRFRVSLIPHTIKNTVFRGRKVGDLVNIEFDSMQSTSYVPMLYSDEQFMLEAIKIGDKGRYTAPPNPWVGCVLAKDGYIIGSGYHKRAGLPHAEIIAIQDAIQKGNQQKIKGCTAYVTLEPCHHHGRTPPCDLELIKYQVGRVVIAIIDPDRRVNGEGIKLLRQNNIQITTGICSKEAEQSLEPYLHHRKYGTPFVVVKAALSLDGRIACADNTSQWITGPTARRHVHQLRAQCQAIIVGSETALIDNPQLTVRDVDFEYNVPIRVVLDARGRVTKGSLLDVSKVPTIIYTTAAAPQSSHDIWKKSKVTVKVISSSTNSSGIGVNLLSVLQDLGKSYGILSVLIEGGSYLQNSFIQQNLSSSLVVYFGSCLIGSTGKSWSQSVLTNTIAQTVFWKLTNVTQLDDDVCLEYRKKNNDVKQHSNL